MIDPDALQRYLAERLPDGDAPLEIERIRGGHSNETFFVNRGPSHWVLRRPPRGPLMPTAHDVEREYRVLSALATTQVPVPRPLLFCDDTSVIGAPFYVMQRVEGDVIRSKLPDAFAEHAASRAAIGMELVDTLAA
ncbi:MAG TPA: phosphotransferase family protein, partial [Ktedonobacterales bacterium]|nr:phosphotransferase family protein [Ktedonobacterales bacterium]